MVQKMGFPPGFELGASHTTASRVSLPAWAAISFPYETPFYDVIGLRLNVFLHYPLLDFVGLWTVRVNDAQNPGRYS